MEEFVSFVGAFHMTLDIIKTKWKSLLLAVVAMCGVALAFSAVFNFLFSGWYYYSEDLRQYFFNSFASLSVTHTVALFCGFLFIAYITENYFRDQKGSIKGALGFFRARFKNYAILTGIFVMTVWLLFYLTAFVPKILCLFVFIILFKYVYAYFASAFFNYGAADSLKLSARLTKGFRYEIFMRSVMLAFAGYVFVNLASIFFNRGYYYNYSLLLFTSLTLVFFVIYNSVMFLSLFNVKQI
jgi:TRAP-type C4-dicarboxylate transport system permease small subunit